MKLKNLFQNKKIIIAVTTILAIAGVYAGSTYALYTSATKDVVNEFTVGSIDTELVEQIDGLNKKPSVVNTGKNACLVRMRVTISPSDVGIDLDLPGSGWVKDGDFYYYEGVVEPGDSTAALFTKVTLPADWYEGGNVNGSVLESKFIPFDIGLYQEAVQAVVYDADGDALSAKNADGSYNAENAKRIWEQYDTVQ